MPALKLLCSIALQDVITGLKPQLDKRVRSEIAIEYGIATTFKRRIENGEHFDVTVLTQSILQELIESRIVVPSSFVDVAKSGLGLAVRQNCEKPDISSTEALKRTLLSAPSIASSKNGLAGFYFMDVLEELGIAQQTIPKLRLETTGGYAAEIAARGDAELAVQLVSEILPVQGVTLVGPFPEKVQKYATLSAGISMGSRLLEDSDAILGFLMEPAIDGLLQSRGLMRC